MSRVGWGRKGRLFYLYSTAKFDISTAGKINLHNEKLDLTFLNCARKGIGVSVSEVVTPYLTIAGTLANPHLELDVISATAASYVVTATMGLSILVEELWERSIGRINDLSRVDSSLIQPTELEKLATYPPAGLKNCSLS